MGYTDSVDTPPLPASLLPASYPIRMIRWFALFCTFFFHVGVPAWTHGFDENDRASHSDLPRGDVLASLPLGVNPSTVIDLAIDAAWQQNRVEPASMVDDSVFVRRLYLDLVGRIPHQHESESFVKDRNSLKREILIDRLLDSEEHAEHWAEVLDAILIGRTDAEPLRRRTQAGWLDYLKRSIRVNRPWNEIARDAILARPTEPSSKGASWYLYSRNNKSQDIAEAVSKDFFGVKIDCAQCHDHPLSSEIEQRHYWGLVAFFNRSKNVDTPDGPAVSESAIGGFSEFSNLEGESRPNELVYLDDRKVEESRPAKDTKEEDRDELYVSMKDSTIKVPKFSRREKFASEILENHPRLASGMVNKVWAWMMGRGIVHPVDAMDSYHPASHPGLLDWLGRDYQQSGYDTRRLLKTIAMTRVYQLSSAQDKFTDPQWFASGLAKPLTAEMLLRSWIVAFEPVDAKPWQSLETRVAFAKAFPEVMAEETIANVAQGLLLTNGKTLNDLVSIEHSSYLRNLRSDVQHAGIASARQTIVVPLFRRLLGRDPESSEGESCERYIVARSDRLDDAIEGVAWALATSAEFRFNH
jgi:hypothetical protein